VTERENGKKKKIHDFNKTIDKVRSIINGNNGPISSDKEHKRKSI
jgi:hypothetical protein